MGQYFTPLNIDKREHESICASKLGEFLFGHYPHRILLYLLRLTVTFKSPCDENNTTEASARATCFPKFPPETVSNIFNEIDNMEDCFCLALTSKRCWLIGQPRMKTFILDLAIRWAGDRVICVGDYVKRGDLPQNFLSTEEEEMLDGDDDDDDDDDQQTYCDCLLTLCNRDLSESRPHYRPKDILDGLCYCEHLPWQYQTKLRRSISIGYRAPEILRNISKRQYVRRGALLSMTCPAHWEWDQIDLGHVVLARISWSSDPSVSMSYEGDIHRGVWAGDRLDITSEDALDEKDENGQLVEWTDVTDEVLKEMYEIWLSEYGLGLSETDVEVITSSTNN